MGNYEEIIFNSFKDNIGLIGEILNDEKEDHNEILITLINYNDAIEKYNIKDYDLINILPMNDKTNNFRLIFKKI